MKKLTIEDIKNATWELHDNWTDGTVPESSEDSQVLYNNATATIDGHEIGLTYSEELGQELCLDGRNVMNDDLLEDCSIYEAFEAVENKTGQYLEDCKDLLDRWNRENRSAE